MPKDEKSLVAGLLLTVIGMTYGLQAWVNYDLGSLRRIGPGMFPVGLGAILAVLGLLIAFSARVGIDRISRPELRPLFAVLLAFAGFAIGMRWFGTVPAIFALVLISVHAERGRDRLVQPVLIATTLSVLVWLVFKIGLSLPLDMFRWRF